ncbi:MAG: N-acetylglucosamine-6-phosphate deacetylase [Parasporobacterium sp.]|nr:N-acetylglucosamine-6-phosphate deacetylase [Parasporobacterium sp.]
MIIKNGLVFNEDTGFEQGDLCVHVYPHTTEYSDNSVIDAEGMYVIPGLIDIHTHGCVGHDFCAADADGLRAMSSYLYSAGVTGFCPTSMTFNEEKLSDVYSSAAEYVAGNPETGQKQAADSKQEKDRMQETDRKQEADRMQEVDRKQAADRKPTAGQKQESFRKQEADQKQESGKTPTADILGINMEGPFISLKKCGAQNTQFIQAPDVGMFERLQKKANGLIRLVTLAPEAEGAMEFIDAVSGGSAVNYSPDEGNIHIGVSHEGSAHCCALAPHISLGHTEADYDTCMKAFGKGCDHVTHICNGMSAFNHREPGLIGAAADSSDVFAEVICDGIHIHPAMFRSLYKMFGPDRLILISDSLECAGMPDGKYNLGGQEVFKSGMRATLADGTLAGSCVNLFQCFRNAVNFGVPLEDAVKMAAVNPARSIGLGDVTGSLKKGCRGGVLILDKQLNLIRVVKGIIG